MEKWMNQGTTLCYHDIKKDIEYCHKYGFNAIELKYNVIKNYDIDILKRLLKGNHIMAGALGAVSLPIYDDSDTRNQMEMRLEHMCQIAVAIECANIVIIPQRRKQKRIVDNEYSKMISMIKNYLEIAGKYGRKLAFEVMGYHDSVVNTFQKGLEIIREISSDKLGLILDFYHFFGGNMDKNDLERAKASEIFIVHADDGRKNQGGNYLDADRLFPGDGEFELDSLMKILKEIQYSGPISLEVYRQNGWTLGMEECYKIGMQRLERLLNEGY